MSDDCQCPICGRMHRHLGTPPLSVSEQIARDMKQGTFPKKSKDTLLEEAADRIEALEAQTAADLIRLDEDATIMIRATARIEALEAALRALVDNVNDYERVNNLSPTPPRTECWDTVAHAKRLLALAPEQDK